MGLALNSSLIVDLNILHNLSFRSSAVSLFFKFMTFKFLTELTLLTSFAMEHGHFTLFAGSYLKLQCLQRGILNGNELGIMPSSMHCFFPSNT